MKKHWRVFITLLLATFLFVVVSSVASFHFNALSAQTSQDVDNCKEKAVCLDNHFIFLIENENPVGDLSPEKRAKAISERIEQIADNTSIKINDLNNDSLLDNDNNIQLSNQELERLKSAIKIYRKIHICRLNEINKKAVCLDNHFIFLIENENPVGGLSPEKRAEAISERIEQIADNTFVDINSLENEKWKSKGITAIKSPQTVIFTLTDEDVKAAKIDIQDKEKLASQYLERIKDAIRSYRRENLFRKYFNLKEWDRLDDLRIYIILLIIIFLLVILIRIIYYSIDIVENILNKVIRFSFNLNIDNRGINCLTNNPVTEFLSKIKNQVTKLLTNNPVTEFLSKIKNQVTKLLTNNPVTEFLSKIKNQVTKLLTNNPVTEFLSKIKNQVTKLLTNNPVIEFLLNIDTKVTEFLYNAFAFIINLAFAFREVLCNIIKDITKYLFQRKYLFQLLELFSKVKSTLTSVYRFIKNSLGITIEIIVFLITIALVFRLILMAIVANKEAFFEDNLIITNTETFFKQTLGILQVVGLIFLFTILSLLLRWLSRKAQGTVIIPFEDTTKGEDRGKAIADSLVAELFRIRYIHQELNNIREQQEQFDYYPSVSVPENLADNFTDIATVTIKDTTFNIGKIVLLLKRLWPFGGINNIISGSVHAYDSVIRLVVQFDYQNSPRSWEVSSNDTNNTDEDKLLPEMIKELAYKISFSLYPHISAETWETFKHFTEAIYYYKLFQLTQNIEKLDLSCEECKKAIEYNKNHKKIADLYYEIGISYAKNKKFYDAKKAFQEALRLKPNEPKFYYGLGNVYGMQKKYNDAKSFYNTALELDREFALPHNGLGNIYFFQGAFDEAEKEYNKAIKLSRNEPKFWQPHHNLGNVFVYKEDNKEHNYEKAIKKYEDAIEKSDDSSYESHSDLGWAYLLKAIYSKQNSSEATQEIEKNLIRAEKELIQAEYYKKSDPTFYFKFGTLKLYQGQLEKTQELWQECVKLILKKSNKDIRFIFYRYVFYELNIVQINSKESVDKTDKVIKLIHFFKERIDNLQKRLEESSNNQNQVSKGLLQVALHEVKVIEEINSKKDHVKFDKISNFIKAINNKLGKSNSSSLNSALN